MRALCDELGVEDEERNPTAMVGVVVSEDDQVDRIAVNAETLHRDKRRGAAIDKEVQFSGHHMKAGVKSPSGSERIAAADELKVHIAVLTSRRQRPAMA